jgi:hypothetical protein
MTSRPTSASQAARVSVRMFLLHGVTAGVTHPLPVPVAGAKSCAKYWYLWNGTRYGPKASSCTPYFPNESSIQYLFIVVKRFSGLGVFSRSR